MQKSRREFLKWTGAATFMTLTASSLAAKTKKDTPNILWITCEDISPALGCYGDDYARTPNLDTLAQDGRLYENAYATAPICAPARSCLITGMYATSLGTQHLRSEIPVPQNLHILPEILREHGYFCSNNSKTDYNFDPTGRWNENSSKAHWRNRPQGTPFFSVFNYTMTHEGHGNTLDDPAVADLAERHDPEKAKLPPYFPNTETMREIWAHYYDLVTVLDTEVGKLLQQLEDDGLRDNTIIFFFSDHGFGLPRYKRWPYNTGLHVPLILWAPEKYRQQLNLSGGETSERLVSFVDIAPTVLNLLGIDVPSRMEGQPFLGQGSNSEREYMIGARSRADDCYDVCRTVRDPRYLYIRNFMPHLPYIQNAIIFSDTKSAYAELDRVRQLGDLPVAAKKMYAPKPLEELYDLQADPFELINLADDPAFQDKVKQMRKRLDEGVLETRDTGFLNEGEMMLRGQSSTPFQMARNPRQYDVERIYKAAKLVGDESVPLDVLLDKLADPDSGVRYWVATAMIARGKSARPAVPALQNVLQDDSPVVRITAAEALCHLDVCENALDVLGQEVQNQQQLWLALQAAISIRRIGAKAEPLVPVIRKMLKVHSGDVWGRYKNWMYPMFIGMALDMALLNCGLEPELPLDR